MRWRPAARACDARRSGRGTGTAAFGQAKHAQRERRARSDRGVERGARRVSALVRRARPRVARARRRRRSRRRRPRPSSRSRCSTSNRRWCASRCGSTASASRCGPSARACSGSSTHDQRVSEHVGGGWFGPDSSVAPYRRAAHRRARARARSQGQLDAGPLPRRARDRWLGSGCRARRAHASTEHSHAGRLPSGVQTLMVLPGTVIRTEPKWVARELAVDRERLLPRHDPSQIDDAWAASRLRRRRRARARLRRRSTIRRAACTARTKRRRRRRRSRANAQLPRGHVPVRVAAGRADRLSARRRMMASSRPRRTPGWFTVAFDTPWGPITLHAHEARASTIARDVWSARARRLLRRLRRSVRRVRRRRRR